MAKADNSVRKPSGYGTARRQLGVGMRSATAGWLDCPSEHKDREAVERAAAGDGDSDAGTKIQRWAVRDRA